MATHLHRQQTCCSTGSLNHTMCPNVDSQRVSAGVRRPETRGMSSDSKSDHQPRSHHPSSNHEAQKVLRKHLQTSRRSHETPFRRLYRSPRRYIAQTDVHQRRRALETISRCSVQESEPLLLPVQLTANIKTAATGINPRVTAPDWIKYAVLATTYAELQSKMCCKKTMASNLFLDSALGSLSSGSLRMSFRPMVALEYLLPLGTGWMDGESSLSLTRQRACRSQGTIMYNPLTW